jgi:hypothetical protein
LHRRETIVPGNADRPLFGSLDPREQDRLAAILSRLSSPYENERATAGLLASVFVARHGLMWRDLTTLLLPIRPALGSSVGPYPQRDRRRSGAREWRGYCRRRRATAGANVNFFA